MLQLVYDPTRYDAATKTLEMPIRLKNTSDRPIYPPIIVSVVKFGSGLDTEDADKANAPQILNATNGSRGAGATFDYSRALGDFEALPPGGVTSAVVWRLKLVDPMKTPNMHIEAGGTIEK
jgi:hypothetical protein